MAAEEASGVVRDEGIGLDILEDLLLEIMVDTALHCVGSEKAAAARSAETQARGGLREPTLCVEAGLDIFGNAPSSFSVGSVVCEHCGRSVGAARFTNHLAKCVEHGRQARNRRRMTASDPAVVAAVSDADFESMLRSGAFGTPADTKQAQTAPRKRSAPAPRQTSAATKNKAARKPSRRGGSKPRPGTLATQSVARVVQVFSKMCGVVNLSSRKMCANSLRCPKHAEAERIETREYLTGNPTGVAALISEAEFQARVANRQWGNVIPPSRPRGRPRKDSVTPTIPKAAKGSKGSKKGKASKGKGSKGARPAAAVSAPAIVMPRAPTTAAATTTTAAAVHPAAASLGAHLHSPLPHASPGGVAALISPAASSSSESPPDALAAIHNNRPALWDNPQPHPHHASAARLEQLKKQQHHERLVRQREILQQRQQQQQRIRLMQHMQQQQQQQQLHHPHHPHHPHSQQPPRAVYMPIAPAHPHPPPAPTALSSLVSREHELHLQQQQLLYQSRILDQQQRELERLGASLPGSVIPSTYPVLPIAPNPAGGLKRSASLHAIDMGAPKKQRLLDHNP